FLTGSQLMVGPIDDTMVISQRRAAEGPTMEATTIGIDLAKSIFHLVGMSQTGKVVWRKALTRARLLEFLVQHQRAVVGMEACATAHYWAREIQKLGHEVRLMNPSFVTPYRKSGKN